MSVDPLAAGGAADLAALIDAELASLAADAQALRALLVEDAVVTARVLPSNGLTDLLDIAGRRVAASLPPTVRPGDVLQVQVTGFDGDRILLQVVGTGAAAAVEPGPPGAPGAPAAYAEPPPTVSGSPAPAPPPQAAPPAPGSAAPAGSTVSATGSAPGPAVASGAPATGGDAFSAVVSRASVAPSSSEPAAPRGDVPFRAAVVPGEPTSIEARLAAARAAPVARGAAPFPVVPPPIERAPGTIAPPAGVRATEPVPPGRFVAPPQIAARAAAANQNATLAASVGRSAPAAAAPAAAAAHAASAAQAPAATGARGLAAYAEPVALLRALRLAVTPSNVAAATLALQKPERLPEALAVLERALPRASADPHVATLRTLLPFVGRIDPRSPALSAQIAAYVEHVVDGAEPKLATLLAAARAAEPVPAAAPPPAPTTLAASGTLPARPGVPAGAAPPGAAPPAGAAPGSAVPASPHPVPASVAALPAAVVAERSAALGADLKQTLLLVAADARTPPAVAPALAGALSALTAVQVTAAQTMAANPGGIAFTIPLSTQNGPATARIAVSRERGGRNQSLDGENFRIAFVLDTAHYGTVAIDLVTVGRDVTVDVRAENSTAMRAFRDALGSLTARLEGLRYRVAAAGASVGVTSTVDVAAPPAAAADPNALVDRSA